MTRRIARWRFAFVRQERAASTSGSKGSTSGSKGSTSGSKGSTSGSKGSTLIQKRWFRQTGGGWLTAALPTNASPPARASRLVSSRPRPRSATARASRLVSSRLVAGPPTKRHRPRVSSRLVSSFPRRREPSRFARERKQTGDSPPSSSASLVIAAKSATQQDNAKSMHPAVYLVASRQNGTLYTGVTSNLVNRIWEHRSHRFEGFTANHDCTILVWFEMHATMTAAFVRERVLALRRIASESAGFPHSRE